MNLLNKSENFIYCPLGKKSGICPFAIVVVDVVVTQVVVVVVVVAVHRTLIV